VEIWGSENKATRTGRFLQFFNKNNACNFSIKITHFYAYFGQNSYLKQKLINYKALKSSLNVLNRINEVQVL